jgi:hypothetical protein
MGNDNSTKKGNSRFCEEFVEIVQLILDNEATPEHEQKFRYFMECRDCASYFNLESSTIKFIKEKIENHRLQVPAELASEIRSLLSRNP